MIKIELVLAKLAESPLGIAGVLTLISIYIQGEEEEKEGEEEEEEGVEGEGGRKKVQQNF